MILECACIFVSHFPNLFYLTINECSPGEVCFVPYAKWFVISLSLFGYTITFICSFKRNSVSWWVDRMRVAGWESGSQCQFVHTLIVRRDLVYQVFSQALLLLLTNRKFWWYLFIHIFTLLLAGLDVAQIENTIFSVSSCYNSCYKNKNFCSKLWRNSFQNLFISSFKYKIKCWLFFIVKMTFS